MTNEMKLALFEEMRRLEDLASSKTYDNRNYFEQADGFYKALEILGIGTEYLKWERENRL